MSLANNLVDYDLESNNHSKISKINFDLKLYKLYKIWFIQIIFSILTLGIYSFWGRTKMRKYIFSSTFVEGDRLEYTGKGIELLLGFIKSIFLLLILFVAFSLTIYFFVIYKKLNYNEHGVYFFIPVILFYTFIFYLTFVGRYLADRYRYSRITYKSINFRLRGSALHFGMLSFLFFILKMFTFYIIAPYLDRKLYIYKINNTYYGNTQFEFLDENFSKLLKTHFITLILAIPTLGISRIWYFAQLNNYCYGNTKIGNLNFLASFSGGDYFFALLLYVLMILLTFGLGMVAAENLMYEFYISNITIKGDISSLITGQTEDNASAFGEGVGNLLSDSGIVF